MVGFTFLDVICHTFSIRAHVTFLRMAAYVFSTPLCPYTGVLWYKWVLLSQKLGGTHIKLWGPSLMYIKPSCLKTLSHAGRCLLGKLLIASSHSCLSKEQSNTGAYEKRPIRANDKWWSRASSESMLLPDGVWTSFSPMAASKGTCLHTWFSIAVGLFSIKIYIHLQQQSSQ